MKFTGISWYVAPTGSPQGDGSAQRPWDLATALAHPEAVQPGDVIWLAGGTYHASAPLNSSLLGTEEAPIEIWGDPEDEPAVVEFGDGRPHGLHIGGAYTWYGDFELRSTAEARWSETAGSVGDPRGIGILSEAGPGVKLIRLRVRDFGTSMFESQPHGIQVTGCMFSNSYWDAPDRSHGPGLYVRNPAGAPRKRIENCVIFQHGRQGLQGFGSTPFAEMDVVGNFFFNNGVAHDGFHRNFMFGNASDEHRNVVIEDNVAYLPTGPSLGHEYNLAGGDGGSHGLQLRGNWISHEGRPALRVNRSDGETIEGNRFIGDVELTTFNESVIVAGEDFEAHFPGNEYYRDGARPSGAWVRVRADATLPSGWRRKGRAHVAIFNWELAESVGVDLTELEQTTGLEAGSTLRIASAQNTAQAVEVVYTGAQVEFPMTGWTPAWPAGRPLDEALPPTFPEFGVFIVDWTVAGEGVSREPVRASDPGAGLPTAEAWAERLQAWSVADPQVRQQLLAERRAAWRASVLGRPV